MKPLRILILTNRIPYPLHDGGALAMDAMIRGYHEAGMEVYVLAMNTTRHPVPEAVCNSLYQQIAGFDAVPVNNDVRALSVLSNLLFSKEPEHVQRFYHPAYAQQLEAVMASFQPDVVQLESPFLTAYLPLIRNSLRVLRVHNMEHQIWERLAKEKGGIKGRYLNILAQRMKHYEARIWQQYDLLLPITEVDAEAIRQLYPSQPMLVAPYGIETQALSTSGRFTKTYHIGAMDWLPNTAAMDWLLKEIWPLIKAAVPEAEFHFGGRGMPERFFHHLPPGVFCHGEVPDVAIFYQDKEVLLVPLRAGGGIRIKILEAMAAGKLVISTEVGMQGIEAVAGIHYLSAATPEEFKKAMVQSVDHPEAALAISRAAMQLIQEKYSNQAIMARVISRLQEMCARKAG